MARLERATPSPAGRARGRRRPAPALLAAVALVLTTGCSGDHGTASPRSSASTASTATPDPFPTSGFADLSDEPVAPDLAARLDALLAEEAGPLGTTAAVVSTAGSWVGAAGVADGRRRMRPEDQLAIASLTKPVVAAQVMRLVEEGELALDDPVADHLPPDVRFDPGAATIRDLLAMRSGIPDPPDASLESLDTEPRRRWTAAEGLALIEPERQPPGERFYYANVNYVLLRLVVEQVAGRPLHEVFRAGVLAGDGLERLVLQPAEAPTPPLAMPSAASPATFARNGGFLPSLAIASLSSGAGGMASDAATLARWWAGLCSGDVVSEASLTEMTVYRDGYGLGLESEDGGDLGPGASHTGRDLGFSAWAGCFPEAGVVVVALTNDDQEPWVPLTLAEALGPVVAR